ncbi:MAG: SIMPL domain-containing protein [Gammaproteobacteria bacterium]
MNRLSFVVSLFLCFHSLNALASENITYNRIHFSVIAEKQVSADEIIVTMSVQRNGPDIAMLADQVNRTMKTALKTANKEKGIQVETLNYQTNKNYQKGKQSGWQVSQSMSLIGSDMEQMSELIGKLQAELQLNSITYQVSSERKQQIEDELSEIALKKFTAKAAKYSNSLNRSNYQIVQISLSNQNTSPPRPMLMARQGAMMAAESIAAPSIQPGDQKISITATGSIELAD